MDLVVASEDSKLELGRELARLSAAAPRELAPGLLQVELGVRTGERLAQLVFARQLLPDAKLLEAVSIRAWAEAITDSVVGTLPDGEPWALHVFPFQPVTGTQRSGARAWHSRARAGQLAERPSPVAAKGAGQNRCRLIREAVVELLRKRRRHLLRSLRAEPSPFVATESLVQLALLSPEQGALSLALGPLPFEQRHVLSHLPAGYVAPASDKAPPSRAFAKLVEAELRLGRRIQAPETCVDLGASPGSWTYVAAKRGAKVTSVDRSELRADLMRLPNVRFERGDAFRFEPPRPVDWLICDVIAAAERSAELLRQWLRNGWCRRFIVTLKLDDASSREVLERLETDLLALTSEHFLLRLCANKKEVCAFGARVEER